MNSSTNQDLWFIPRDVSHMKSALNRYSSGRPPLASAAWGMALLLWLIALAILPDPRPLGAPEWLVQTVRSAIDVSDPSARAAATIVFRSASVGLIGVLLALSLQRVPTGYAAPFVLVATPLIAVGVKWINFGYLPISPQIELIVVAAIVGGLAGLALRRNRIALAGLVTAALVLSIWGTSTGVTDDLYEAARAAGLHVLEHADEVPSGDESFARLLEVAFAYAEDNSHGTGAILPNQAAMLAMGVILGEDRVARVGKREIDAGRTEERAALRRRVTVHGRGDLSQHFWVSAALTVLSDPRRSLTVGIGKEMKDSTAGGSGFSFVDMAANKAGIGFAVAATRSEPSARAIQLRIADGVDIDDFFPDVRGLPEGITRDELQFEYGGLGGAKTRAILEEIDRRVLASKGLDSP